MLRRLFGLMLIVRGLSPLLVVIVIAVTGSLIIGDVQAAMQAPVQAIENEINTIKASFDTIRTNIDTVRQQAATVVSQVQSFAAGVAGTINTVTQQIGSFTQPINNAISGLQSTLNTIRSGLQGFINAANSVLSVLRSGCRIIPGCPSLPSIPSIPNLNLPNLVPNLTPLINAMSSILSPLQSIFNDFAPAVDSIRQLGAALQTLPDKFNTIIARGGEVLNGLRSVVARWGSIFTVVIIILAVLTVIYFGVPVIDNISRGWRLLRGLPAE